MENRNDEFPIKPILLGLLLLLGWKVIEEMTRMVTIFFSAMLTIAIIAASLGAAYLVFSFIRNRELGENKKIRKINRIEAEMKQALARTPKHLHHDIKEHCLQKQRDVYAEKPSSHIDDVLDRTKQILSTFRGGRNGNKDSHR